MKKKPEVVQTEAAPVAQHCKCQGCKKMEARFTFCDTHFEWFKFGLITKEGKKVRDFEAKWTAFERHGFAKPAKAA